jgi:hypothetical protein
MKIRERVIRFTALIIEAIERSHETCLNPKSHFSEIPILDV